MERKDHLDTFGATSLVAFALLMAFNQVLIAVGGDGWQPAFMAALRSFGSALVLAIWMAWWRVPIAVDRAMVPSALMLGVFFGVEFAFLFVALDLTTVSRASVIYYSMPFWAAIGAHLFLGERITRGKLLGLACAFLGMAWAIWDGAGADDGSWIGDLCAMMGAIGWAAILIVVKGSRVKDLPAETQLFWQLAVSVPILMIVALFFGPLIRDLAPIHWASLAFQILVISCFAFLFWFWLLKIYPATSVASFSFLSPVFSVALGAALLGETVGWNLLGALALVALGLILINRKPAQSKP